MLPNRRLWNILILALAAFSAALWLGGCAPGQQDLSADGTDTPAAAVSSAASPAEPAPAGSLLPEAEPSPAPVPIPSETPVQPESVPPSTPPASPSASPGRPEERPADPDGGLPAETAAPPSGDPPLPVEPQDAVLSEQEYTCTLSVCCGTVLDHMDALDPDKAELIPEDGVIFPTTSVTFYEGESVFNVLQREMKKTKIHLEFTDTPLYNSAYIEGIHNLYEFDCGELSGWMYKVNGWFPNYGCSRYQLQDGDIVEWLYTCDLGADIGGYNALGG